MRGESAPRQSRRGSSFVFAFLAASLIAVWFAAVAAGWIQREATLHHAEDDVYRMNQIVAEQAGNLLLEVKAHFQMIDVWLQEHPRTDPRTDPELSHLVGTLRDSSRVRIDYRFISAQDGLFAIPSTDTLNPSAEVGDREYVIAQKSPSTRGYFVGSPVLSRISGVWIIPLSFPLTTHNSGLTVLFAAVELPVLNELFETVRPRPDGAITLIRADGVVLDHVPFDEGVMGVSVAGDPNWPAHREGVQTALSLLEHQDTIVSFRSVPGLPLEVSVSLSQSAVLGPWVERMAVWSGVLAVVSALLLWLAVRLGQNWGRLVDSEAVTRTLNEDLRRAQELTRIVTENSNDIVSLLSLPDLNCEWVSPSVLRHRGWSQDQFLALPRDLALGAEMAERIRDKVTAMLNRLASGEPGAASDTVEVELPHRDGHLIPYELMATIVSDERGQPSRVLTLARDLSERKANEQAIRHMAFYDRLTALPNRRLLEERLHQLLAKAGRDRSRVALLFIDLDEFKPVNDTMGHAVGDWLLQQVASRMLGCVRASDTVARIGGDEFVVALPEVESTEAALGVAEKLRSVVVAPYSWDSLSLAVSASVGVVLYPDHARDQRELLRLSDEAMYQAKRSGRNRVVLYTPSGDGSCADEGALLQLRWQEAYFCGEPSIDRDHQELFLLANVLLERTLGRGSERLERESALDAVVTQMEAHFEREEMVLRDHGYADVDEHARLHRQLMDQVGQMKREYAVGTLSWGELVEFLVVKVVSEHLQQEDRKFFDLFARS